MNAMTRQNPKDYIGYDYKDLIAEQEQISFLLDAYENFGWELDERTMQYEEAYTPHIPRKTTGRINESVTLHLKRDRKILNKTELTRLQRNFEACVRELDVLELRKTSKATMRALIIGFIGTIFMAGSVFAIVAEPPHVVLSILLAVPAFIGWILPFFVYRRTAAEESARINLLIEQKYDEIHNICERGSKLL